MFGALFGLLTTAVSTYFAVRAPIDDRDKPAHSTPLHVFLNFLNKLGVWKSAPPVVTTNFVDVDAKHVDISKQVVMDLITPATIEADVELSYSRLVEDYILNPSPFMSLMYTKPDFNGPNILGYQSLSEDINDISKWLQHVPFQGDVIDVGVGFGRLENQLYNHKTISMWYGIDLWEDNEDWGNQLRMVEAIRTKQKGTTYFKGDAQVIFPLLVSVLKKQNRPISFVNIDGNPKPSINIALALQAYDALSVGGIMCLTVCQNTTSASSNYIIDNHDYINSALFVMSLLRYRVKLLPQYSDSRVRLCFQKLDEPVGGNWASTKMWGDPCSFDMFQMIGHPAQRSHQLTNTRYINFMTLGGRTEMCTICGRSVEVGHHDGWYEEACALLGDCVPDRTETTAVKPPNF
uniref:Uncharacterized protein n=1 Tax=Rhizoctonia cerealis hypovirus TaxID=3068667 RepID=A0AA51GGU4_9VIRU|nr:MAG: hypothetical protein [Rhizoctonia cerealis hypovirus]